MNWSSISADSLLGKALRRSLRLLPPGTPLPIIQGRLRGKKWIVGSGNHGHWLGSYEDEMRRRFETVVKPGTTVFDVGAHVGYYSLLSSVLVGRDGAVFAFEPLPRNVEYLKRHIRLNRITNVTVVEAAVSDRAGSLSFEAAESSYTGRISADGGLRVRSVAIDMLVSGGQLPTPDCMKIDTEGAELQVLKGARALLETSHPVLFLSTHSPALHQECCRFLEAIGYRLEPIVGDSLAGAAEILGRAR